MLLRLIAVHVLEAAVLPQVPLLAEGPVAILAVEILLCLELLVRRRPRGVLCLVEGWLPGELHIKLAPVSTHLAVLLVRLHAPRTDNGPADLAALVAALEQSSAPPFWLATRLLRWLRDVTRPLLGLRDATRPSLGSGTPRCSSRSRGSKGEVRGTVENEAELMSAAAASLLFSSIISGLSLEELSSTREGMAFAPLAFAVSASPVCPELSSSGIQCEIQSSGWIS